MSHTTRHNRRGSYATVAILTLPVILGVGAIAVDLSYQRVVAAELQATSDLAALAGSRHLDKTPEGLTRARDAAVRAAGRNKAGGKPVVLATSDVDFGAWGGTGELLTEDDAASIDSLRVKAVKTDVRSSFAHVSMGVPYMWAGRNTVSVVPPPDPAGAVSCFLPLAVAMCQFEDFTPGQIVSKTLKLNPAGIDTVGWGRPSASPNADWVRDQISHCEADGAARVGEPVGLQNGVISSALFELIDQISISQTTYDTEVYGALPPQDKKSAIPVSDYGKTVEGAIFVFDGGPEYCQGMGGSFNGSETIVGFAWAAVYDVRTNGASSEKNIWVKLNPMAEEELGFEGGGLVDAGVMNQEPPVRVQ